MWPNNGVKWFCMQTYCDKQFLNMTSLLPVVTMSVNVTVYMYRRRRALESKD